MRLEIQQEASQQSGGKNNRNMINIIKKKECTGCKLCKDCCPKDAICFETDQEGFWYPRVDNDKCVKCGKCIEKCPSLSRRKNPIAHEPEVYAAWALDDNVRIKSTSGGVFYCLARHMLDKGGVVAACKYTDDYKSAYHTIGDTVKDLDEFMGSKYFQSDTEGIYKAVKEEIDQKRSVLFCGAPCQVAGLNRYVDPENVDLITVDFICRGINSPMVFKKYVEECEKHYDSSVRIVHLKNKRRGWTRLGTYMEFQNGKKYYRDRVTDPWVNGYIRGDFFMRPCCSECLYKERVREADISIGDFWGLPASADDLYKGISVVLANTDKGAAYLEQIEDKLFLDKHTYEEALNGNGCLLVSATMGKYRDAFFSRVNDCEFEKLVWELLGEKKTRLFVKELKLNIKYWLGR